MENTKLACIKFATVNSTKEDPYELAIPIIDGGTIHEPVFYRFNIENAEVEQFGGIIPEDGLRTGKTFTEQWPEIKAILEKQDYIIAFRAGDDFNALDKVLKKRNLQYPNILLIDVQNIARRTLTQLVNYQYLNICEELGIDSGSELSNLSYLSAHILKGCMSVLNITGIDDLLDFCEIKPGRMSSDGYEKGVLKKASSFEKDPKAKDLIPDSVVLPDENNFFYGKNVLFTGSFGEWGIDNKDICKQGIRNIGGFPQDGLNRYTNVLVEGIQTATKKVDGKFSTSEKQEKVRARKAKGQDSEIVSGAEFVKEAWSYLYRK